MKTLYFDCTSGISGDMAVGAMIHAGLPLEYLRAQLQQLPNHHEFSIECSEVVKAGISACQFEVINSSAEPPQRRLSDIEKIIETSRLSAAVKDKALSIFRRLGEAEAKVHGCSIEEIHFHEIGAIDSIVDVVSVAVALDYFKIDRIVASPVALGTGTVKCAHGILPVPVPAVLNLLEGALTVPGKVSGELTTPTGAAILACFAEEFGPMPALKLITSGYGAGQRNYDNHSNTVRVVLGETDDNVNTDTIAILECTVDDSAGESIAYLTEKLMAQGALDVFVISAQGKKNRPAHLITVLSPLDLKQTLAEIVLRESSSFGLRVSETERMILERRMEKVHTDYGEISVKIGILNGEVVQSAPEYEECRKIAEERGIALKTVYQAALAKLDLHSKRYG